MRITKLMVLARVSLSVLGGQVLAQQSGGFTPQQLDEMSKQRMQELGPRNWGPPPPQSSVPSQNLPPAGRARCLHEHQTVVANL